MENVLDEQVIESNEVQIIYSGFWPRLWALLLDGLIFAPFGLIAYLFKDLADSIFLLYLIPVIQLFYKPVMEYTKGYTLGKLALGIKVVNLNFEKANLGQIILRNIFTISSQLSSIVVSYLLIKGFYTVEISTEPFAVLFQPHMIPSLIFFGVVIVELIMLVTDDRSRSLHDRIGQTFVIKSK
ncbi:MAG: RDD family protein [Bacteroidia bacterium]